MLTPETLREVFDFDPKTGALFWRFRDAKWFKRESDQRRWNNRYAGEPAFTARHGAGYRQGSVLGEHLLAHRVLWALAYGEWPEHIDHINGHRDDNRLCNLRSVTPAENRRNCRMHVGNKSGVNGVHQRKQDGRFLVNILVNGRTKHIGLFDSLEMATVARKAAERALGYHPNHGLSLSDQSAGGANNPVREVSNV